MRRGLALAAAATLAATVAQAAPADRYHSAGYKACMDKALSTLEMRGCIAVEDSAWDKQLNAVYQALMASGPTKPSLRDDERVWLKRTAHKCDHAGDDEAGGTLQGIEIAQCYLDEKILRTVYLRGLR